LKVLGVEKFEKFVIVRFVSWAAAHDFGHTGMSLENKRKAVELVSKHAKVFISSEKELPSDLEQYRIRIPVHHMHDCISFATLLFGESATMASEAVVLGTHAIFLDNDGRGYTEEEEERYDLVFNFTESEEDQAAAIQKAVDLLSISNLKEEGIRKRANLLHEKIDTTKFMIEQIEQHA
jgi:predicted glycosyltransferase